MASGSEPKPKSADYEYFHDLNNPIGIIWPTVVEAHGVVPISSDVLTVYLRLEGNTLTTRFFPQQPTKLSDFLTLAAAEPPSTSPVWKVEDAARKAKLGWYIFPDTHTDPSVVASVEIRQRSGHFSIKGLLGDKPIASAQLNLAPLWKDLLTRPEGITEMRDLVGPKVDAGLETLNAPARSTDKSRITITLRYEKLRDIPAPLAQLEKLPKGVVRHRVFSSPLYYKHNSNGMKDHSLNMHSARIAAESWINAVAGSIQLLTIETVSVVDDPTTTHDTVVVWFRKL